MTDVALIFDPMQGGKIVWSSRDLLADDGLQTAIVISLFSDRRCATDQLPDNETDQRGFWADAFSMLDGDSTGSLLWLLRREKTINSVLGRAKDYARDALRWLVDDKVAQAVNVETEYLDRGPMAIYVEVIRPTGDAVSYRFEYAWEAQAAVRNAAPRELAPADSTEYDDGSGVPPDFTGYFNCPLSSIVDLPACDVSEDGLSIEFTTGTNTNDYASLYFGNVGNTGKWLMLAKLEALDVDNYSGASVYIGFGSMVLEPTMRLAVIGGTMSLNNNTFGNRSASAAQAYRVDAATDYQLLAFDSQGGQNAILTEQYVAVCFDFDTGHGEIISGFGSTVIEDMNVLIGAGGPVPGQPVGDQLAGLSLAGFVEIDPTIYNPGSVTTGTTARISLVPSSAPHGLTLPAGYTNIVPD